MFEFLADIKEFQFLQYALFIGIMASVSCGIIGSYVTVRRITYIAGAMAHCTLGGMGMANYFAKEHNIPFISPLSGAFFAALLAAFIIAFTQEKSRARQDTILSAVWSVGMAVGIIFISKTNGYNEDLMSYLFGDILMVSSTDLLLITILDIVLILSVGLFYNKFLAISFDEEFARISGIHVSLYNTIFLCLVAITVVLLVQVVGILLVVALLTLPAAAAGRITKRFAPMIVVSIFLCLVSTIGGLSISYQTDLPAGAIIILVAGFIYLVNSILIKKR